MNPLTQTQIAEIDKRFEAGESIWMWCIHHAERAEPLNQPLSDRIKYIQTHKPKHERETRLRWLQPVQQPKQLPKEYRKAGEAYAKAHTMHKAARAAYYGQSTSTPTEKTRDAYHATTSAAAAAWAARQKARHIYFSQVKSLHESECPGVLYGTQGLIFPERNKA